MNALLGNCCVSLGFPVLFIYSIVSKGTECLAFSIRTQCMFFLDGGLSANFLSFFLNGNTCRERMGLLLSLKIKKISAYLTAII